MFFYSFNSTLWFNKGFRGYKKQAAVTQNYFVSRGEEITMKRTKKKVDSCSVFEVKRKYKSLLFGWRATVKIFSSLSTRPPSLSQGQPSTSDPLVCDLAWISCQIVHFGSTKTERCARDAAKCMSWTKTHTDAGQPSCKAAFLGVCTKRRGACWASAWPPRCSPWASWH